MKDATANQELIDITSPERHPFKAALMKVFKGPIDSLMKISDVNALYKNGILNSSVEKAYENAAKAFSLTADVSENSMDHIPESGSLIVVANHPYGAADGIVLMEQLIKKRPDVKVLANHMLHAIPEFSDYVIPVDVFTDEHKMENARHLSRAIKHVKQGGTLLIFPAGAVAHFEWKKLKIAEQEWHAHVGAIIRKSGASVLPVHIHGRNSNLYQALGSFSVVLRSLMLLRELINKKDKVIKIDIGQSIPSNKLLGFKDDKAMVNYLKDTVAFIKVSEKNLKKKEDKKPEPEMQAIMAPVDKELLALEVEELPKESMLSERKDMAVYVAKAEEIPHVLKEIGRLREISYRDVEEGSGLDCDLDHFDEHYLHLFVWDHENNEVVGAYRMGLMDQIIERFGRKGLYTHTLFKYDKEFLEQVKDSIELGRSFIQPKYREAYGVLPLLWKGICLFMVHNPQYRKLFGGVSISNGYKNRSRNLMVEFLKAHNCDPLLAEHVKARTPYKTKKNHKAIKHMVKSSARNMNDISMAISSVEADSKGIPVLIKHYLKLQAHFLSFNLDKSFSDVVDGLIVVDMDHSAERTIRHYMGVEGYESFMSKKPLEAIAC